eukprot:TRINITY_DN30708_c0_g1_i1.p2 TRINITY_DN30708_c0_g1~~TRINITY_DN30708_c0_g1_i1.p2  ORF type:complete len:129 (-),score=7.81 TRINITY_DN30708_c0_g1_i1:7-393(-)
MVADDRQSEFFRLRDFLMGIRESIPCNDRQIRCDICFTEWHDCDTSIIQAFLRKEISFDIRALDLSLIHISEPTRPLYISYAVFCLKKKKNTLKQSTHTQINTISRCNQQIHTIHTYLQASSLRATSE